MEKELAKLNEKQYEAAVHTEGPLLILAGAGSGKTGTMTHRIAYLIQEKGVSPYAILAVTFTNKAAAEMRERVEALIGPVRGMWIATFHSACLRILRNHPREAGRDKGFVVYDPLDQRAIAKGLVKDLQLDEKRFTPAYVLEVISKAKEKALSPGDFRRQQGGGFGNDQVHETLAQLYEAYEETLKRNNAMDFDDLILRTVKLFEHHPDILETYRQRFTHIMVDEYQDTNLLQYQLVRLLAAGHGNICVVGDDDQCIYQWRGADIRNILEFERDFPGTRVIKLEENYRSTGNILAGAHSVIARNKGRKPKKLWTRAEKGERIHYYRAEDDREEARYIGARIEALMREEGLRFSDFAVLYRTNVQSRRFEESFSAKGIPYQVLSGLRYYERKEVKDIMAYLRLAVNPRDDAAFRRIINEPRRGIGQVTLDKLAALAGVRGESLLDVLGDEEIVASFPAKTAENMRAFDSLLRGLALEQVHRPPSELYELLLVRSGYLPALEEAESAEAAGRIENLLEFQSVILEKEKDKREQGEALTLETLMEELALMSDVDNHRPGEDAVALMTLHSAKGLEFPVVFMPGMEMGIFPSYRSLDKGDVEEERRLCYVGMTRARKRLFLVSAEQRMLYGKIEFTRESQFLQEIDRSVMDGHAVYDRKQAALPFSRYDKEVPYSAGPYVSPLTSVRKAREEAGRQKTLAGLDLEAGQRVHHTSFGPGTITQVEGRVLTVRFDQGDTKRLAKDLAPMTVMEE